MFGVLETEAAQVTERAALAALVFAQPRLAGVLNNGEIVFLGNRVDRVHIARHAVDMHRHNGAGSFGDPTLDRSRVHRQCGRICVGEYWQGLVHQDRVVRGDERVGRDDHFVASIHAHHVQRGEQGSRAAGRGHAALGAEQFLRRPPRNPPPYRCRRDRTIVRSAAP